MEATDTKAKLVETLKKLQTVMLSTIGDGGSMHARPMIVAEVELSGVVWFVSAVDSEKMNEIRSDARAMVTGQDRGLYVSVSGQVDIVRDPARVRTLWKEEWKAWLGRGRSDPSLVLVRLRPEIGEYWDETGERGVRHLFQAARVLFDGDRAKDTSAQHHAKVPL